MKFLQTISALLKNSWHHSDFSTCDITVRRTDALFCSGNPGRYFPGAYVQYVRFKGVDRAGEIINEHKFGNNLCHDLIKIDAFVETSVSQKRPIPISVLREETVANYPYWATRELLMNAIMHRDYETNAPIQFYEYDDRIEIQNPGGLYGKVSPENFPNVSDYRNPFIAEAMKIRLCQSFQPRCL